MGKVKEFVVRYFLGGLVRDIAEGKKGPGPKRVYYALCGWKTRTSAIAGLLFAALAVWQPQLVTEYGAQFTFVLGLAVTAGIADADWKKTPPPVEWAEAFHAVMAYGAGLSALLFAAVELLPKVPGCTGCASIAPEVQWYAAALGSVMTWLAARFAEPPEGMARRATDPAEAPAG